MSESASAANAASQTALTAIQVAANTQFYANVDAQIAQAQAQGLFEINATTSQNVDLPTVFNYYVALGYAVYFPDYPASLDNQPQQLFGQYWEAYWNNILSLVPLKNPARINISWQQPNPGSTPFPF